MKASSNTNIFFVISLFLIVCLFIACEYDDTEETVDSETIDCEYCYERIPDLVDLKLIFDKIKIGDKIKFTVYSGNAFKSAVWLEGQAEENIVWIEVKPNQKYSVVAEYLSSGDKIYVINDAFVKTKFFKYACDKPCHYVYLATCTLKLKKK